MKKNNRERVIFTGSNGFPFGSAMIQRQVQLANSLIEGGYNVVVLNNRGQHSKSITTRENIKVHGYYNKIEYIYCSLLPYVPTNFFLRNILKLVGEINQFFIIFYYIIFKNASIIFNNTIYLKSLKYYHFISRVFKIELIYDYVEIIDSLGNRDKNSLKELNIVFDNEFYQYTDKVIVISDYLEQHLKKIAPNKIKLKIPPIIDFTYFDNIHPEFDSSPFFLFCGSALYDDVIKFIIKIFINSKAIKNKYKLKLVINGSKLQLMKLNEYLVQNKYEHEIEIMTQLSYQDLVSHYKSAKALLIPVGNNIQDQARFPFKICEYTASKRPIITSNSGAIKEFFIDGENGFVAKAEDEESIIDKINLVIEQPELANTIGQNGYDLGKKVFNFKTYTKELVSLIKNKPNL